MYKNENDTTTAQSIALWADKLRDIAASGLRFSNNVHDQENYQTIQNIAIEMFALSVGQTTEQIEPLRDPIFSRRTPLILGDAAVIRDGGQLLLIQRVGSGCWALPGGAFAVGETPASGVAREVLEETGVQCIPTKLVGVYDSQVGRGSSPQHQYNILFLCQYVSENVEDASHKVETLNSGWFEQTDLPSPLEPSHQRRVQDAFRAWHGHESAYFDI